MIDFWFQLTGYDEISFGIVATGIFVNVSCALLGCFLVLRRMSLLGDAISHAILPGLALGFIVSHSRHVVPMLLGAIAVGILTALLTQTLHRFARVPEDAAMGVVFTTLFAIGVIMIHRVAHSIDLDPGCVLYGSIETVAADTVEVFGHEVSRPALNMGLMCLATIAFVALLWKELKISSFDPQLAIAQGINATLVHYLLMAMVAAVTVVAFEAVGAILVVAMLIAPAAIAYMLTDRLGYMALIASFSGVISAVAGRSLASSGKDAVSTGAGNQVVCAVLSAAGSALGFDMDGFSYKASVPGMMAVVAGALFVLAVFFSPSHGALAKGWRRASLALRIVREDILALLYRWQEMSPQTALARSQAAAALGGGLLPCVALWWLERQGRIRRVATPEGRAGLVLTDSGARQARTLVKSHRLWETYLQKVLGFPADHVHAPADRTEHFMSEGILREVAAAAENPTTDPHGRPIPRREGSRVDLETSAQDSEHEEGSRQ